jgi:hypothetical protein
VPADAQSAASGTPGIPLARGRDLWGIDLGDLAADEHPPSAGAAPDRNAIASSSA